MEVPKQSSKVVWVARNHSSALIGDQGYYGICLVTCGAGPEQSSRLFRTENIKVFDLAAMEELGYHCLPARSATPILRYYLSWHNRYNPILGGARDDDLHASDTPL